MTTQEVELRNDCRERVALDLMNVISSHNLGSGKDTAYFLTLYRQCYKAVNGHELKNILQKEPQT